MEDIREEDMTESSGSDGEADSPEFVPSAWDKYAIPIKSALRSPEKSNRVSIQSVPETTQNLVSSNYPLYSAWNSVDIMPL